MDNGRELYRLIVSRSDNGARGLDRSLLELPGKILLLAFNTPLVFGSFLDPSPNGKAKS